MMEYREKKKYLIQLSNNEYYKSNEYKIKNSAKVNYEENTEHRHLAAAIALLLKGYTQHDQTDKVKMQFIHF